MSLAPWISTWLTYFWKPYGPLEFLSCVDVTAFCCSVVFCADRVPILCLNRGVWTWPRLLTSKNIWILVNVFKNSCKKIKDNCCLILHNAFHLPNEIILTSKNQNTRNSKLFPEAYLTSCEVFATNVKDASLYLQHTSDYAACHYHSLL